MLCKNCGAEALEGAKYCTNCGSPLFQETETKSTVEPQKEVEIAQTDEKTKKKEENWKYAKRFGFAIILIVTLINYWLDETSENASLLFENFPLGGLSFIAAFFYPFPDEWSFMRKVWTWFWNSLALLIIWIFQVALVVIAIMVIGLVFDAIK